MYMNLYLFNIDRNQKIRIEVYKVPEYYLSKSDDAFYWIIIIKRSNNSFSDLKWLRDLGGGPWTGTEGHETAKVGTGLNQFTIKHDISQNSVHINGVVQQFTVVRGGRLPPSFQFNMLCNFRRYKVRCPGLYITYSGKLFLFWQELPVHC